MRVVDMNLRIATKWDGHPVDHDPVLIKLLEKESCLQVNIEAPFFNDPPPQHKDCKGQPTWQLWDYEGNFWNAGTIVGGR